MSVSSFILKLVAILVLPPIVCVIVVYLLINSSAHDSEFKNIQSDRGGTVATSRDINGVAYISATRDYDAFYALGYMHAQDRGWQLEIQLRKIEGRLSEIFGSSALDTDVWHRTLNLLEISKSSFDALSEGAQLSLKSYSAGINAWRSEQKILPSEYYIFGATPSRWEPAHTIAWIKYIGLLLDGNLQKELDRYLFSKVFTTQHMEQLFLRSEYRYDTKAVPISGSLSHRSDRLHFKKPANISGQHADQVLGSNGWVVSGRHTESGSAILANDPHLPLQIPSHWYAVHIQGQHIDVRGMSLVGVPLVVFGRNRRIAWAGTSMFADTQDIVFEEHASRLLSNHGGDGERAKISVLTSDIHIKSAWPSFLREEEPARKFSREATINGPIINATFPHLDFPASLRWTGFSKTDKSYEALYRLNYAEDWNTFQAAFADHITPTMNMIYADCSGNIGLLAVGQIPERDNGDGSMPTAARQNINTWSFKSANDMPRLYNPDSGIIVNANNKPVDYELSFLITSDWAPEWRAQRITKLLTMQLSRTNS